MTDATIGANSPGGPLQPTPRRRPPIRITPILDDSHTGRNWEIRWIELMIWIIIFIPGSAFFMGVILTMPIWYNVDEVTLPIWWIIFVLSSMGALLGAKMFGGFFAKRLTKIVPRNQGLVTTHLLARWMLGENAPGSIISYGPGLHISSAFEIVHKGDNISTMIITFPFSEEVSTETAQAIVEGFVQVRASLRRLARVAQVDENSLREGSVGIIKGHIQARLASSTLEQEMREVDVLSSEITDVFAVTTEGGQPHTASEDEPTDFEREYGYDLVAVGITSLDPPEAVQKARDSGAQVEQVMKLVARMAGARDPNDLMTKLNENRISVDAYRRYIQLALMASKTVTGQINVQEIAGSASDAITAAMANAATPRGNDGQGGRS